MRKSSPWSWVPSLYFAEGIPYVVVATTLSVIMFKRLGVSNTDIALYTSWLYLPWVIKPFWSPIVDLFKTKRWWIVTMQLFIGAGLAGIALTIPLPNFFQYTLAIFWLIAFSSATHDIAADGFYMLGLDEHTQAYFIGIRSTFYRIAMITGQGLLIIIAGFFESYTGLEPVRFSVNTVTTEQVVQQAVMPSTPKNDALTFIVNTDQLALSIQNITKQTADSIKNIVRTNNLTHGFVLSEEEIIESTPGWWTRNISNPLAGWLKGIVGRNQPEAIHDNMQGNMGIVAVRLSKAPEANKEVVLNVSQRKGDNSIHLAGGERLVFTEKNWDKAAFILIQLDPKLDKATSATFEGLSGNIPLAWSITFFILAGLFICFFIYHRLALPRPATDQAVLSTEGVGAFKEFSNTFSSFFEKEGIVPALSFILLYRLGEAQLVKMASPFLLDSRDLGGLGLTTGDVGLVYGTIGIIALTLGGIIGGIVASNKGLKYWIWWMALAINLPHLTYIYMAFIQPENMFVIATCVAIEQLGYGFGFTAYMLFLIYFCEGKHKTAHFALCTGFMALGMMLPGMLSGWIQDIIGYDRFFVWVLICAIPPLLIIRFLKINPQFGVKPKKEKS